MIQFLLGGSDQCTAQAVIKLSKCHVYRSEGESKKLMPPKLADQYKWPLIIQLIQKNHSE